MRNGLERGSRIGVPASKVVATHRVLRSPGKHGSRIPVCYKGCVPAKPSAPEPPLPEGVRVMRNWSLKHVDSGALLRDLKALAAQESVHLAKLLAHIGEVHERKLYRDAGQPHMHAYCVNVLHFSEDAAWKRIHVAGVARRIPALLDAIAAGRLHLSGACEIAAHL